MSNTSFNFLADSFLFHEAEQGYKSRTLAELDDELKQYLRIGVMLGAICASGLSILYISGAGWFFGLFFKDAEAISDGIVTSMIVALITLLQILRIICVGAMAADKQIHRGKLRKNHGRRNEAA